MEEVAAPRGIPVPLHGMPRGATYCSVCFKHLIWFLLCFIDCFSVINCLVRFLLGCYIECVTG